MTSTSKSNFEKLLATNGTPTSDSFSDTWIVLAIASVIAVLVIAKRKRRCGR